MSAITKVYYNPEDAITPVQRSAVAAFIGWFPDLLDSSNVKYYDELNEELDPYEIFKHRIGSPITWCARVVFSHNQAKERYVDAGVIIEDISNAITRNPNYAIVPEIYRVDLNDDCLDYSTEMTDEDFSHTFQTYA